MLAAAPPNTASADSLCKALVLHARTIPDAAWAKGDAALAPEVVFDVPHAANDPHSRAPPFEAAIAKSSLVRAALPGSGNEWVLVDRLRGADIYAVSEFQGTFHCQFTAFVRGRPGGRIRVVDGPGPTNAGNSCWTTSSQFARVFGQPAFVTHDGLYPTAVQAAFQVTPWTGETWGSTCRAVFRLRADYRVSRRFCGDKAVCLAAEGPARDAAVAYNRQYEAKQRTDTFSFGPPAAPGSPAAAAMALTSTVDMDDLPTFGIHGPDILSYGGSGHLQFPLSLDGKIYVAAIGHAGVGWRENENTLVSIYGVRGASLTPLAGFVVTRSLGGLVEARVEPPRLTGP